MQDQDRVRLSQLARELRELADEEPEKLGQRVRELPVRQQAELALLLPAKQRLELMLHAPRPMRLVRALPDSELYLTVRELGPADALPLVALASARQLHHIVDLESWRRDRFDERRSGAWVAVLLEAGEPALRRFLKTADDELLALLFQRWVRVEPLEVDEDPGKHGRGLTEAGDERGLISPDGEHRFRPVIAEHAPAVQRLAQIFFVEDHERYHRILWSASFDLPGELEEDALRWRGARLEEHGFPPWEEAIGVYAPPRDATEHPALPEPEDPDGLAAPRTPVLLPAFRGQLTPAIDELDDEMRERVLHEFLSLGNKLLVADSADTGEPEAHRAALSKAARYVQIALAARGVGDAAATADVLRQHPLVELFREGYGLTVQLARMARKLMDEAWPARHPGSLELLDPPLGERLEGLRQPRPLYHAADGTRRPFASLGEVEETRAAVEMAEVIGWLLIDRLGLDPALALGDGQTRFSGVLLTLLAWHSARDTVRVDPLPADVVADFLRNVASRRTAPPDAPARAMNGLLDSLAERFEIGPRQRALVASLGRVALERLADECSSCDPGAPLDRRAISCLLLDERG